MLGSKPVIAEKIVTHTTLPLVADISYLRHIQVFTCQHIHRSAPQCFVLVQTLCLKLANRAFTSVLKLLLEISLVTNGITYRRYECYVKVRRNQNSNVTA